MNKLRNPLLWALPIQSVLLFWRLDLLEPWGDELFTLDTAPQSLHQIASIVAGNIHPPLYFCLLHFWIQLPGPGTLLMKMREMSAIWGLLATVVFYLLWLRKENRRVQHIFLLLWILSPCLLLYARMARSYTMQLTLALLAIYAAGRWMEKLRSRRWFVAYALTSAALLYTHYLPGLAIVASTSIVLLFRRDIDLSVRTRFLAAAGSSILIMILYAPWLATMHSAVSNWVSAGSYRIGSILTDQTVRLVYWFVSFGFGEAFSTLGILLGVAMTPVIVYALWRSLAERGDWFGVVLIASGIAYIGVCRWAGFPFTPARILFALPFFLILCVRGIHAGFRRSSPIFVGLLILYATGLYSYFSRTGYLNKGYCVPYQEMAAVIRNGPAVQNATLVVDTYSSIPDPLLNLIPASVGVIALDEDSAGIVREAVNRSEVVWFWRHTHDTSPGEFVSRLEHELSQGRFVAKHEFLPYSQPERWALGILRGPAQPEYFYQLLEVRK